MKATDGISIIKKASLLCGADFFGTTEIPEADIRRIQMLDGGTGMNFEQLFVNLYAEYCEKNGYTKTELDNVAHFFFEENKLTDREKELRRYIRGSEEIRTGLTDIAPGCYPPGILLGATWNPAITAKMGEVRNAVRRTEDAFEEFQHHHADDEPLGFDRNKEIQVYVTIGEHHSESQQQGVNGT